MSNNMAAVGIATGIMASTVVRPESLTLVPGGSIHQRIDGTVTTAGRRQNGTAPSRLLINGAYLPEGGGVTLG